MVAEITISLLTHYHATCGGAHQYVVHRQVANMVHRHVTAPVRVV
jgi:hypothetical protein